MIDPRQFVGLKLLLLLFVVLLLGAGGRLALFKYLSAELPAPVKDWSMNSNLQKSSYNEDQQKPGKARDEGDQWGVFLVSFWQKVAGT